MYPKLILFHIILGFWTDKELKKRIIKTKTKWWKFCLDKDSTTPTTPVHPRYKSHRSRYKCLKPIISRGQCGVTSGVRKHCQEFKVFVMLLPLLWGPTMFSCSSWAKKGIVQPPCLFPQKLLVKVFFPGQTVACWLSPILPWTTMPCTFCAPPLQVSPLTAVAEREKAPRGVAAPAAQLFHLCTKTSPPLQKLFSKIS